MSIRRSRLQSRPSAEKAADTTGVHKKVRLPEAGLVAALRNAGLRPTRQRLALAALLLQGEDRHVSAEALQEEAAVAGIQVSLATIYNSLNQFTAAGLLRQIVVDGQRSYFDTNTTDHHHFFDEDSGVLEDIPADRLVLSRLPAPPAGTEVRRVDVVVRVGRRKNP